jgi:hypothetical protein
MGLDPQTSRQRWLDASTPSEEVTAFFDLAASGEMIWEDLLVAVHRQSTNELLAFEAAVALHRLLDVPKPKDDYNMILSEAFWREQLTIRQIAVSQACPPVYEKVRLNFRSRSLLPGWLRRWLGIATKHNSIVAIRTYKG